MPRASRQHHDVAHCELEHPAARPTELHPGASACDAEDLVNLRVIVDERVDAVAPLAVTPAVCGEPLFENAFRALFATDVDGADIKKHRQYRIVRHRAVVLEQEG